ncbi:MAG TPA: DUF305 domain-containing protein [Longimicrobiaceae bacterium]|nr:DUF305 domain-containing protein [Longimicrobiaceae bacterium]
MSRFHTLGAALTLLAALGTPAAAQAQADASAVARARADSLRYPYTEADIRFMTDMIGHHAQAIVMSKWAPSHGASATVQRLAARIINSQRDEIATMQRWLRARNQPVPDPDAPMKMDGMGMHGDHHPMLMPGMLTPAQMERLDAARGPEFDRLFLTFMIQHHRGALTMVEDLFSTYGAAQDAKVFKFASDVNVDQATEVARMQKMLADLVFADFPGADAQ